MPAGFASGAHGAALRALNKPRVAAGKASGVRRAYGELVRAQCPCDWVLNKTVSEYGAAMVEDDGVGLARCRAQNPPDHLPV
jgi:hypothetical protein